MKKDENGVVSCQRSRPLEYKNLYKTAFVGNNLNDISTKILKRYYSIL